MDIIMISILNHTACAISFLAPLSPKSEPPSIEIVSESSESVADFAWFSRTLLPDDPEALQTKVETCTLDVCLVLPVMAPANPSRAVIKHCDMP